MRFITTFAALTAGLFATTLAAGQASDTYKVWFLSSSIADVI
jgi:hypothetical protein